MRMHAHACAARAQLQHAMAEPECASWPLAQSRSGSLPVAAAAVREPASGPRRDSPAARLPRGARTSVHHCSYRDRLSEALVGAF